MDSLPTFITRGAPLRAPGSAIKWFTQITKPLKTCSFLSATIRLRGSLREKSRASGRGAGGIVRLGKLKLTFHCFVCLCVCVRSISGRVKQYRRLFSLKKCGYPVF